MRKRIIAVFLCGLLTVSMAACQKIPENSDNIPVSTVNQEQTNQEEEMRLSEEGNVDENGMPEESESMYEVLMALAVTSRELNSEYAVWNEEYFWMAVTYLIGYTGSENAAAENHGDTITLPAEYVKEYANALFAGYDGNTADLPDLPEQSDMVIYDDGEETYTFTKRDTNDAEIVLDSCKDGKDGTWQIQISLYSKNDDRFLGSYSTSMQATSYTGTGKPFFHYMITVFDPVKESNVISDNPDNISQEQALAFVEQRFGKDGEADPDTGNIFSINFEEITTIDGVSYYNFRVSWLVLNENGEADHSSYLTNMLVSVDGGVVANGTRDENGNWEIIE